MFEIDLLKGKGVPPKPSPARLAILAVPFIVPIIFASLFTGHLMYTNTVLATAKAQIAKTETKLEEHSDTIKLYQDVSKEAAKVKETLSEVAQALERHIQVSKIIQAVVETMPDSIVLSRLNLQREDVRQRVKDKTQSNTPYVEIIKRTLKINVYGMSRSGSDDVVQEYVSKLRTAKNLGLLIDDIKIVARKDIDLDGKMVPCYEIDCLLKSEE